MNGCRTSRSQVSKLVLRAARDGRVALLHWNVARGAETDLGSFGNPRGGTAVLLCLYDSAELAQPVLDAVVAPGGTCEAKPCWKLREGRGYQYRNRSGTAEGLVAVRLRASAAGGAQLSVKGRGARLAVPARSLALPVLVQLVVDDANATTCWSAEFEQASHNDARQFRASSP
jgi:hypothetical protein